MEDLWEVAFTIAGIGGIASFVLWSLYRKWLSIPIFVELTQEQLYKLLRLFLILTFLFSLAGLFSYLIVRLNTGLMHMDEKKTIGETVFDQWISQGGEFLRINGVPSEHTFEKVDIWEQFFEKGYVIYDATSGISYVFGPENVQEFTNPKVLITSGLGNKTVNNQTLTEVLKHVEDEQRAKYERLVTEKLLRGGIGTLYIKHDLMKLIGPPVGSYEHEVKGALKAFGKSYMIYSGVGNHSGDYREDDGAKAIWIIFDNKSYSKIRIIY